MNEFENQEASICRPHVTIRDLNIFVFDIIFYLILRNLKDSRYQCWQLSTSNESICVKNGIPARRNLWSTSQVQLLVYRYRKEQSGRRGFFVSSPQLWNLLSVNIRLSHNNLQKLTKCNNTCYATDDLMCVTSVNSTITTTTVRTPTATDITIAPATERIGPLNRAIVRKITNFRQFLAYNLDTRFVTDAIYVSPISGRGKNRRRVHVENSAKSRVSFFSII